jgi:hypothetical protein
LRPPSCARASVAGTASRVKTPIAVAVTRNIASFPFSD